MTAKTPVGATLNVRIHKPSNRERAYLLARAGGACVFAAPRAHTIYLWKDSEKIQYDVCAMLGHETLHLVCNRIDVRASRLLDIPYVRRLINGYAYAQLFPNRKDKS